MSNNTTTGAAKKYDLTVILFCISIVLLVVGALISYNVVTSGGRVKIEEVAFIDDNGALLKGAIYIPKGVDAEHPAPAVIVGHGYSSNYHALEIDAVELARRGVVALAVDSYDHGKSGHPEPLKPEPFTKPDPRLSHFGMFGQLQFLGRLPYVDKNRIGLTGHSMGAENSRLTAKRAFALRQTDPSVIVPRAVLLQANSPKLDNETKDDEPVAHFGISYGVNVGRYDEFAILLWGIPKAADYKTTKNFKAMVGIPEPDNNVFYRYGNPAPLTTREEQLRAGREGSLRIGWIQDNSHSTLCFSRLASRRAVEFFDLTLCDGKLAERIPYDNQIWPLKTPASAAVLIGVVMFMVTLGLLLLRAPFFKSIIKPEPVSLISMHAPIHKLYYTVFYAISFLVPFFTFFWANEDRIFSTWQNVIAPVSKWPYSNFWNLPLVNGSALYSLVHGAIMVVLFAIIYFALAKPNGGKFESTGLIVPAKTFGKSILLGAIVFFSFFIVLNILIYFTGIEFGFYKFWLDTMSIDRWGRFVKYFLFFFVYAVISGVCLNSITRINGLKEWQNFLLMLGVSFGGLLLLQIINTQVLYRTGQMLYFFVPGSKIPNSFAILLLFGTFFSVPSSVVFSRVFYKKTGNVWVGAVIVSMFSTFLAVGSTLVSHIL
ncbi:MAG: hypothetical protein LBR23_03705 [Spirochaetaceae bacterium]|jgi:hypothetical protein|nr:hypothetical protein [Spirochaetaceae bacterium]